MVARGKSQAFAKGREALRSEVRLEVRRPEKVSWRLRILGAVLALALAYLAELHYVAAGILDGFTGGDGESHAAVAAADAGDSAGEPGPA